jgi:hypothetical protein
MKRRPRGMALQLAAVLVASTMAFGQTTPAAPNPLQPYTVSYAVEWKGITAGVSTLTLKQTSPNNFTYDSTTVARGFARLFVSDAVKQTSQFKVEGGKIVPVNFRGVDEKERETKLDFDWSRARVAGTARGNPVDLAAPPGTQDAMSLQIATALELAAGSLSRDARMIDGDKIKEYEQRREGTARIKTALGELDTVIVTSQRKGSNRLTRTWYAPSLGYVPVQAQRVKEGKPEVTMRIRTLQR